jgi:hypothetical protein
LALLIGLIVALLSIGVFVIGLQDQLSRVGSGLDMFKMASGSWGTLVAYPSFGFWAVLVAVATMLAATVRRGAVGTLVPATVPPRGSGVVPMGSTAAETAQGFSSVGRVNRPRGVTFLIVYCTLLGVCAIACIPFVPSLVEVVRQLPLSAVGIGVPDQMYLIGLLVLWAVTDFVIALGLLRRIRLMRLLVRILSVAAVVGSLVVICFIAVVLAAPGVLGEQMTTPLTGDIVIILYGRLILVVLLGLVLPLVIARYLGRQGVREYFGMVGTTMSLRGPVTTAPRQPSA